MVAFLPKIIFGEHFEQCLHNALRQCTYSRRVDEYYFFIYFFLLIAGILSLIVLTITAVVTRFIEIVVVFLLEALGSIPSKIRNYFAQRNPPKKQRKRKQQKNQSQNRAS